ncbi:hypothetical protein BRD17_00590 [Halobacteriales archaeon SW_7_68_16]|nr:MAG: hypothetical protein BRD17_00590 [Halobacteriales archaeon SW_7_68_16]
MALHHVRPVEGQDVPDCVDLVARRATPVTAREVRAHLERVTGMTNGGTATGDRHAWIVATDGKPIGVVGATDRPTREAVAEHTPTATTPLPDPPYVVVEYIHVDTGQARDGVGATLLRRLSSDARDRGMETLVRDVRVAPGRGKPEHPENAEFSVVDRREGWRADADYRCPTCTGDCTCGGVTYARSLD